VCGQLAEPLAPLVSKKKLVVGAGHINLLQVHEGGLTRSNIKKML